MAEAWVTLVTTDGYASGGIVLAHSLKAVMTTRRLHCMITNTVSSTMRDALLSVFDEISMVDIMNSDDAVNLNLIGRPELGVTFTKLNCWKLTQYAKCVFLDADCLVIQNCDELFERDELSASADTGWPDCFNSGVFVFRPSVDTYNNLVQFAMTNGSFDGGDQGLLNMYFNDWRQKPTSFHLPFIYNMTANAVYSYAAAYKQFGAEIKIVHFIGAVKPWHKTGQSGQSKSVRKQEAEPISEPRDVPEPMDLSEPKRMSEPDHVCQANHVSQPPHTSDPVHVSEPTRMSVLTHMPDPTHDSEPAGNLEPPKPGTDHLAYWQELHEAHVVPLLESPEDVETYEEPVRDWGMPPEEREKKCECGFPEYVGYESFEEVWQAIEEAMQKGNARIHKTVQEETNDQQVPQADAPMEVDQKTVLNCVKQIQIKKGANNFHTEKEGSLLDTANGKVLEVAEGTTTRNNYKPDQKAKLDDADGILPSELDVDIFLTSFK